MPRTERFSERIGAIFVPEADTIDVDGDSTLNLDRPPPDPFEQAVSRFEHLRRYKRCAALRQGCYTLSFVPVGSRLLGTRYQGTLRVENSPYGLPRRISGDLYTYLGVAELVNTRLETVLERFGSIRGEFPFDREASDTGGTIPIYARRSYHSYLQGTGAELVEFVARGADCTFTLNFDEFVYNHPATGFIGTFNQVADRSLRWVLRHTGTPDLYTGDAYVGNTNLGTVSIRWISDSYRRAHLQINTLAGAVTPPASVGTSTIASMFADVGWDLTVTDGGTVQLPAALAGVDTTANWLRTDLHTLMSAVAGYNAADLDSVWRVHLVAVPGELLLVQFPNGRGVMFDSSTGADPNSVPREGAATFSHDGYPAAEDTGGPHYDTAADQEQRNVPRAYLRSATHEVGHAFNQIHQNFEDGADNSIMTPTPSVAFVLGTGGTFPDQINLAFNDTVRTHLRHQPDPWVRPGAMQFGGSAINAPQAADVGWLDTVEITLLLSSERVSLGEPVKLDLELKNAGPAPLPVPANLAVESLTLRINVTDPTGKITFMRPERIDSCPRMTIEELAPGSSVKASTTLYWGQDGFAFETPGRHVVEVIVLWDLAGVPVGASAERDIFVNYPVSDADNQVAALLLDPDVGVAVAVGELGVRERAAERVKQAAEVASTHPAIQALDRMGLTGKAKPRRRTSRTTRRKRS
jgi:hypothetical protein